MRWGTLDELNVRLAFPGSTRAPDGLSHVLGALEREPLVAPTHASVVGDRRRRRYARGAVVASTAAGPDAALQLWRRRSPKYTGAVSLCDTSHNEFRADYDRGVMEAQLPALFEATTRLAEVLRPEFGFVHMLWRLGAASEYYNGGIRLRLSDLQANGLARVHARTWFGPDLVAAIGAHRLLALPWATRTSWGGIQLDLTERPWEADFETLRTRQREVLAALEPFGVVGNYSGPPARWEPGPDWRPPAWNLQAGRG